MTTPQRQFGPVLTDPPTQAQPGKVYRFKHKSRGVFEGRIRIIETKDKQGKPLRPWFTIDVTKGNDSTPGPLFGGYFDLVTAMKEVITP